MHEKLREPTRIHTFFKNSFIKQVRSFSAENNLPPKALLLVDNCSAHGTQNELIQSEDGDISVFYLPPNVTALIQPMDQCPIKVVKMKYKSNLMKKIIAEENTEVATALKSIKINNAISILDNVWNNLSPSVLKNAWNKLIEFDKDEFDEEDCLTLIDWVSRQSELTEAIEETRNLLENIAPGTNLTTEEIEEWNRDELDGDDIPMDISSDSEDDLVEEIPKTANADALNSVNDLIKWCNENPDKGSSHMASLMKLRTSITEKIQEKPMKQTNLLNFIVKK